MANTRVKDSSPAKAGGTGKPPKGVTLLGTEGADTFTGGDGNDILDGRGGHDRLFGGLGNDYLVGREGDDYLDGGSNYDQMDGGLGNDTFVVDHLGDYIIERIDGGTDTVLSSVNWTLAPEVENLVLTGGATYGAGSWRDNSLTGNSLANRLDGREGNDTLDGGLGADTLIGGMNADLFVFSTALGGGNVDSILDFAAGVDRIALDDAVFAGLAPGALDAGAFAVGSAASEADDRILYDPTTGTLSFDSDGLGGLDAIAFATLQPGLPLGAGDFIVV